MKDNRPYTASTVVFGILLVLLLGYCQSQDAQRGDRPEDCRQC